MLLTENHPKGIASETKKPEVLSCGFVLLWVGVLTYSVMVFRLGHIHYSLHSSESRRFLRSHE